MISDFEQDTAHDTSHKKKVTIIGDTISDERYARILDDFKDDRAELSKALLTWARTLGSDDLLRLSPAILAHLTPLDVIAYHENLLLRRDGAKSDATIQMLRNLRFKIMEAERTPVSKNEEADKGDRNESASEGAGDGMFAILSTTTVVGILSLGIYHLATIMGAIAPHAYGFTVLLNALNAALLAGLKSPSWFVSGVQQVSLQILALTLPASIAQMFITDDTSWLLAALISVSGMGIHLWISRRSQRGSRS